MFREVGVILDQNNMPISWSFGGPASVDFNLETLWELHKLFPRKWTFIHVHPEGILERSEEDLTTMQALAMTLSPHEFDFDIITEKSWISYLVQAQSMKDFLRAKEEGRSLGKRETYISHNFFIRSDYIVRYVEDNHKDGVKTSEFLDMTNKVYLFTSLLNLSRLGVPNE